MITLLSPEPKTVGRNQMARNITVPVPALVPALMSVHPDQPNEVQVEASTRKGQMTSPILPTLSWAQPILRAF